MHARLAAAIEHRHDALRQTAGLNELVFDALVILAARSWQHDDLESGYARVMALVDDMDQGRRKRLVRLGFSASRKTGPRRCRRCTPATSCDGAAAAVARSPAKVATNDDIGLVRALGFVAWSDERLAPEEREMLTTVMDALGIPDERRRELCEAMRKAPPSLDEIRNSFSDDTERRFAVAQAILMAQADGEMAAAERRDIALLAGALGIDDEELTELYAAVDVTNVFAARVEQD